MAGSEFPSATTAKALRGHSPRHLVRVTRQRSGESALSPFSCLATDLLSMCRGPSDLFSQSAHTAIRRLNLEGLSSMEKSRPSGGF